MARNLDGDAVGVAVSGGFYKVADVSTITGSTIMSAADHLGYTHSDGGTITPNFETKDVVAYENGDVVRSVRSAGTVDYEITIIQAGDKIRAMYYGAQRDPATGKITWDPNVIVRGSFVYDITDMVDGVETIIERHVIPKGEITALRAITVKNGEPVAYGVTITARRVNGRCVDVYAAADGA